MTDTDTPTVESVFIRGEAGSVFKMDLPLSEPIEDRLRKGYLTRVADADGNPYLEGVTDNVPSLPTTRPAINAAKAERVGWAVAQGMSPDDAEAFTKTDLIELYGTNGSQATTAPQPGVPDPTAGHDIPEDAVAETVPEGTEITPENAGTVITADGVEHVGEIPVEAPAE